MSAAVSDNLPVFAYTSNLAANTSHTSPKLLLGSYTGLSALLYSDVQISLRVQFSGDGVHWDHEKSVLGAANTGKQFNFSVSAKWTRFILSNSNLIGGSSILRFHVYATPTPPSSLEAIEDGIHISSFNVKAGRGLSAATTIMLKQYDFSMGQTGVPLWDHNQTDYLFPTSQTTTSTKSTAAVPPGDADDDPPLKPTLSYLPLYRTPHPDIVLYTNCIRATDGLDYTGTGNIIGFGDYNGAIDPYEPPVGAPPAPVVIGNNGWCGMSVFPREYHTGTVDILEQPNVVVLSAERFPVPLGGDFGIQFTASFLQEEKPDGPFQRPKYLLFGLSDSEPTKGPSFLNEVLLPNSCYYFGNAPNITKINTLDPLDYLSIVVKESSAEGGTVELSIRSQSWNHDKADGTGKLSKINPEAVNCYRIILNHGITRTVDFEILDPESNTFVLVHRHENDLFHTSKHSSFGLSGFFGIAHPGDGSRDTPNPPESTTSYISRASILNASLFLGETISSLSRQPRLDVFAIHAATRIFDVAGAGGVVRSHLLWFRNDTYFGDATPDTSPYTSTYNRKSIIIESFSALPTAACRVAGFLNPKMNDPSPTVPHDFLPIHYMTLPDGTSGPAAVNRYLDERQIFSVDFSADTHREIRIADLIGTHIRVPAGQTFVLAVFYAVQVGIAASINVRLDS